MQKLSLSDKRVWDNTGQVFLFSLNQQEREKAKKEPDKVIKSEYSLSCKMGVWDEGVSGSTKDRDAIVNLAKRGSNCFFFPYHTAMLFDAARELQKRKHENEELKRSNLYTRIGLWVAAGALSIDALVEFLKNT